MLLRRFNISKGPGKVLWTYFFQSLPVDAHSGSSFENLTVSEVATADKLPLLVMPPARLAPYLDLIDLRGCSYANGDEKSLRGSSSERSKRAAEGFTEPQPGLFRRQPPTVPLPSLNSK
jgi:hypothetical protein